MAGPEQLLRTWRQPQGCPDPAGGRLAPPYSPARGPVVASPLDSGRGWGCHPPGPEPLGRFTEPDRLPQLSLHTPVGDITVSEEDGAIVALDWGWGRDQTETPLLRRAREQLHAYFDGARLSFDLPLAPAGTPYRRRVWEALRRIPAGATRTYGDIAREAGGSPRSVGGANGANPIPILIPCHRVVAGGGIGGYSGGDGLPTKRYLLALEARALQAQAGARRDVA